MTQRRKRVPLADQAVAPEDAAPAPAARDDAPKGDHAHGSGSQALTVDQEQHLQVYALANPRHELNERCFYEVHTFREISITFLNLRANSKAFLALGDGQHAIWSEGCGQSKMAGVRFSTNAPALSLRTFLINAREMILETFADCDQLNITLYLRTEQDLVRGRADLPPGASVTLQSRYDRTSLIGLSSFAVVLERETRPPRPRAFA